MEMGDLAEDTPGLPLSPLSFLSSPFPLSPSSETSRTFSAQAPSHSVPDQQSTQQPARQHPENLQPSYIPLPVETEPPFKRPRFEDSSTLWTLVKNKPVGIAFPQKIETRDEYGNSTRGGVSKTSDSIPIKKFMGDVDGSGEKAKLRIDSSSSGSYDDSCMQLSKPYLDSGFAENSCTEVGSSVDGYTGNLSVSEDSSSDSDDDDDDDVDGVRLEPRPADDQERPAAIGVGVAKNTPTQGPGGTDRAIVEVPKGRRCHVFISHSTSDRFWAERTVLEPLSKTWKVRASFQFMPDSSRYDDADIMAYMGCSCVVIIGLSPAYDQSGRCTKEWKHAVELAKSDGVCVLVASVGMCSRPVPLKRFTYLDFISKDKFKKVWKVLQDMISGGVKHFQQNTPANFPAHENTGPSHYQHSHQQSSCPQAQHHHHHHLSEHQHNNYSHHQHLQQQQQQQQQHQQVQCQDQSPCLSGQEKVSSLDSDEDNKHSMQVLAEFEEMYEESRENLADLVGNRRGAEPEENRLSDGGMFPDDDIDEAGGIMEHYGDDQMTSDFGLSTSGFDTELTRMLGGGGGEEVKRREKEEEDGEKWELGAREEEEEERVKNNVCNEGEGGDKGAQKKPKIRRGSSGDIEEGEVSDSSEEVKSGSLKNGKEREESGSPDLEREESSRDITKFYNNLAKPDADRRDASPIKLMRNFNNWVKSILLRTYLAKCVTGSTALDLCCGKGGDLLKWKEGRISHLVCADISGDSIEAAKERFVSPKMKGGSSNPPFSAEFFTTDCTKDRLIDLMKQRLHFNISSCQFSLHYSFESYEKAHMMLQNACESLRPEAYFVGTTVDADQLVHRLCKKGENEEGMWSVGNKVFSVTLDSSLDIHDLPLFGARYNFKLHDVVDLPEYLIHFSLLVKMLEEFDMELILKQNFYHFFQEHRNIPEDESLLYRMSAFDKIKGTMSQDEWDVVGLYLVFVFQKRKPTSHSDNS